MSSSWFPGIRRVLRIGVVDRELDDELAFHFSATVEELVDSGWPPDRAGGRFQGCARGHRQRGDGPYVVAR